MFAGVQTWKGFTQDSYKIFSQSTLGAQEGEQVKTV